MDRVATDAKKSYPNNCTEAQGYLCPFGFGGFGPRFVKESARARATELALGTQKPYSKAPKDHASKGILQTLVSEVPLSSAFPVFGPWNQNVRSLCLCGFL